MLHNKVSVHKDHSLSVTQKTLISAPPARPQWSREDREESYLLFNLAKKNRFSKVILPVRKDISYFHTKIWLFVKSCLFVPFSLEFRTFRVGSRLKVSGLTVFENLKNRFLQFFGKKMVRWCLWMILADFPILTDFLSVKIHETSDFLETAFAKII